MTNPLAQDLGGVVLLPCPFCGGGAYWRNGRCEPSFYVACKNCEVIGPVTATLDTAITAWNTRTHSAEIAGALRDAERYRWLRMRLAAEELDNEDAARMALSMVGPIGFRPADSDYCGELDTAIDSAMQQGGGGGE